MKRSVIVSTLLAVAALVPRPHLATDSPPPPPPTSAQRTFEYQLDSCGNITEATERVGGPYARRVKSTFGTGSRYETRDGRTLEHDAEGNLVADGTGRTFTYDWKNRLIQVKEADDTVVRYAYDALDRRISREVVGEEKRLQWYDGHQLIEETDETGTKKLEVVNGRSVDEPIAYRDEAARERRVMQNPNGSVGGIVDEAGKVLEAYEYEPYGHVRRRGAERLNHGRLEDGELLLVFTGEIDLDSALEPGHLTLSPSVEGDWTVSSDGRTLHFKPDEPVSLVEGGWPEATVTVTVAKEVRSAFGVELAEGRTFSFDAADETNRILEDWLPPSVEQVTQNTDFKLRVTFSEPMDTTGPAGAFKLWDPNQNEVPHAASLSADGLIAEITPSEALTVDETYRLELLASTARDPSGRFAPAASWPWKIGEQPTAVWDPPYTPAAEFSLAGNRFGFQGRELDSITGLYDFRARWYDPRLTRFLTRDPLGYVDGPNPYAAFVGDPVNNMDPMGTWTREQWSNAGLLKRSWYSINPFDGYQATEDGPVLIHNYGDWGQRARAWLPTAKCDLKMASEIALFGRARAAAGYLYRGLGEAIGGFRGWIAWSALSNGTAATLTHTAGEAIFEQRAVSMDEGARAFGWGMALGVPLELGGSVLGQYMNPAVAPAPLALPAGPGTFAPTDMALGLSGPERLMRFAGNALTGSAVRLQPQEPLVKGIFRAMNGTVESGGRIRFSLRDLDVAASFRPGLRYFNRVDVYSSYTSQELRYVFDNPHLLNRTVFYDAAGNVVPHPAVRAAAGLP